MFKRNWEIITTLIGIIGLGLTLVTLNITLYNGLRSDMRADREAWEATSTRLRAEARADREAWEAESRAAREAWEAESIRLRADDRANLEAWQKERDRLHTEARADREAWQAETRARRTQAGVDREALGRLTGIVEEVRTARR